MAARSSRRRHGDEAAAAPIEALPAGVPPGDAASAIVIRFETLTGSLYELDLGLLVWRRVVRTSRSGDLRMEGGEVIALGPLRVGYSAALLTLPFDADVMRLLTTSPVVRIERQASGRPD